MTEICILLINISIWLLFFIVQNNYKNLNNKLLEQKHELENYVIDKILVVQEKHQRDMKDLIDAIEDGRLTKKTKTKKKK